MAVRTMEEHLLGNKWQSVIHTTRLWPGEYQSPADSDGNPHNPWGMNIAYFECCTGTPCADSTRASAFAVTKMPPVDMAEKLVWLASLHGETFEAQNGGNQADGLGGVFGDAEPVIVKDGSSSAVQFSIQREDDSGVGGPICTMTAFSSAACALLARHAAAFDKGTCTIVPHGKFESTVQTKLGPKRLVRVVGIDEHATDSTNLAAHFTLEDDDGGAPAAADQPSASTYGGSNGYTLADSVIARCIVAFRNGGWDSCISPTIESLVARRDHHGHGLTKSLFGEVEKWFLREWTLDIKEGARMMQATQLGNFVVDGVSNGISNGVSDGVSDGVSKPGGGGGAAGEKTEPPCAGLSFVTDKQLLYNMLGFCINPPGDGSIWEMLSAHHHTEDEAMKMYTPTARPPGVPEVLPNSCMESNGIGWRSCDACLATETKEKPLKACSGCVCEKYFAARYCSKRCQKKDRAVHKLVCGKTRGEVHADYRAFCESDVA